MPRPKKEPKVKYPRHIDEDFVREVEAASPEALKARIVRLQGELEETQAFLTCDEDNLPPERIAGAQRLKDLKEAYDEVAGPCRDTKAAIKAKTKFIVEQLRKSGALA